MAPSGECLRRRQDGSVHLWTWAAQPGGVTGQCTPTFEAKGVQEGTMKMMYSSQFRLYSGVRQGSILFYLLFNKYLYR